MSNELILVISMISNDFMHFFLSDLLNLSVLLFPPFFHFNILFIDKATATSFRRGWWFYERLFLWWLQGCFKPFHIPTWLLIYFIYTRLATSWALTIHENNSFFLLGNTTEASYLLFFLNNWNQFSSW